MWSPDSEDDDLKREKLMKQERKEDELEGHPSAGKRDRI